jgi:hypothetical protein
VELRDSCGAPDKSDSTVSITLRTDKGTLGGTTTATVVSGVAEFTGVKFSDTPQQPRLTFVAGNEGGFGVAGQTLVTGLITVNAARNSALRFRPSGSFFTAPGQTGSVRHGANLVPTVVIEMLDSLQTQDTSDSSVVVTATVAGAGTGLLSGDTATMASGVANFTGLRFVGCPSGGGAVLVTFTAGAQGSLPVAGKTLVTGSVTVSGVPNSGLVFGANSFFTAPTDSKTVTMGVVLPAITVQVQDSCQAKDTSNSEIMITASADKGTLQGTLAVKVANGLASFGDLKFTAAVTGTVQITFTAGAQGGFAVAGTTLMTGAITVTSTSTPNSNIRFAPSGSFFTGDTSVTLSAVHNVALGAVVVQMLDSSNNADTSDSSVVITVSTATAGVVLSGNTATMIKGITTFSNLTFTTCSSGGATVVLTFTVGAQGNYPVSGRTVLTGPVKITGKANTQLGFAQTGSALTAPGQSLTVTTGQAIPTLRVELRDSCGAPDKSDSTVIWSVLSTKSPLSCCVPSSGAAVPHVNADEEASNPHTTVCVGVLLLWSRLGETVFVQGEGRSDPGSSMFWREMEGHRVKCIVAAGRLVDVIVLGRSPHPSPHHRKRSHGPLSLGAVPRATRKGAGGAGRRCLRLPLQQHLRHHHTR